MAEQLQNQLKELGSKLENSPASKDALIKLLTEAATYLSDMDQSPTKALLESMQPLLNAIVKPEFLKHEDEEVKLLVATCTCEITRITAPEAPYDDDVLKDIFHLFVSTFNRLRDTKSPSFGRIVNILDTVAKYRSFVVMLDLDCDDLVNEMFKTFFAVTSDEHPETVTVAMDTIMAVLLEESEEIQEDLLFIILSILGRDRKDVTAASRRLAMNVIKQSAAKLEPGIKQFIISSISGDGSGSNPHIDYHEVIYDIYRCAPQALSQVVPYLTRELLTDKIDVRLKTVKLLGDLFALEGSAIQKPFHPLFLEFLKRLTDNIVDIRMSVLEYAKLFLLSDPFRKEAPKLLAAISDRLLDDEERIRKQVVAVVSDVFSHELSSISSDTVKLVAERLEDKSFLVKKYTLERVSDIYRTWCMKQIGGLNSSDEYDWIPGRILRCVFDKDFGQETIEQVLCTSLFPVEFSVRDKVKNWVKLFSKFDKIEVKALEKILEQKQRSQLEMQKYLSLRQMHNKENNTDASELQKKSTLCFRSMSQCFLDPIKTEKDFQLLDQSKDASIWRILTKLLDSNNTSLQSINLRDELLKIVDNKDPLYELLSSLSMKCSFIIFDKEFVKDLLLEADLQRCDGNRLLVQSCMNMLVILASFSPLLLCGIEEDFVRLLEDDNEAIKEGVLHVLAKAGETIREQLGESSSSLDLILERICLEGSKRQAKYAVHALAAITKDEGLKSLSVLYKRLVEMLEKRTNLPSVLQSLGCIAQIAMPVFETQESRVVSFIRKDILSCSQKTGDKVKESWDDRSELCSLKISGIKTLVKSYLPVKDAHLRVGIDELIKDLQNILLFGEISKDIESSSVDKAQLKLASAKAVIRLSKHWDKRIPIDIFHLTLRTSEVEFPQVRKLFLNKVHQYIKDRSLDPKYICAFLLDFRPHDSSLEDEFQELRKIDGNSSLFNPEYILPYLIHALAHHPSCPNIDLCKDVKAYELIYRKLYVFFSELSHREEDGKPGVVKEEEITSIISVLCNIKRSVDAVDSNLSKNSYAICDLGLSITKRLLAQTQEIQEPFVPVSLPQVLYTPHKEKQVNKEVDNNEVVKKEGDDTEVSNEVEKKEGDDTEVFEGQTWLADETALAHFESLILDSNGNVTSKTNEDDIETDGNDVPLGKMLKRLKAKGSKAKKVVNNGSTPTPTPTPDVVDNVDILGMLKEINSDNVDVSNKFDSSNGHGKNTSETTLKRKNIANELTNVSVPKRRRSLSAKSHNKRPSLPAFGITKMEDDLHTGSENKVTDEDLIIHKEEPKSTTQIDSEKTKKHVQSGVPVKKRKRRRISGLAKLTMDEADSNDLIGKRIKVWWPMDKAFYQGIVKSYDQQKKKHVILYDDGDVEVLYLDKERWELIENEDNKPTKQKHLSTSPPHKEGSSKKKMKSLGSSRRTKELTDISMVRGKRTPRKNLKQGEKGVSQRAAYLEMGKSKDPDVRKSKHEEVMEKQMKDAESSSSDSETLVSCHENENENENEKSDSTNASDLGEGSDGSTDDAQTPTTDKPEFSDDEPLGVWKSRVGKSVEAK